MSKNWDILRNVIDFVRFSDTKAGVVLAFAGGSTAFLSSKVDVIHGIIMEHHGGVEGWPLYVSASCYLVALVYTIVHSFMSIWPTLGSGEKRSLIYFKNICEDYGHDHEQYAEALRRLDDAGMERELAHQICVNASIATRKYELVGRAIVGLAWVIGSWAGTVFLILILGPATTAGR
jgi:hypothetical protein